ncbi:MAG: ABC transporter substrate-binding protein [Betaproteobacteria bacterium]|jgi:branched-chain amino acid transport system substrate-binding protein|nr:ABC transporter substrate-binding protein [Betaproteobacteria bacterium]
MKQKLIGVLVGAALAACSTGALAQAKAPAMKLSGEAVKIGVLSDMSGLYSDLGGQGSVIAAQMAVDDFKEQAKPAYKIDVVSADHQNKADVGAAKVREWIDREGVDMVTDVLNSAVALATAKVVAEKKRILLDVGAASTRLTNEDCNPYTVHWMYDTYALANGTGKAIVKQGGDSWFFLTADYAFGHSLEKDTAEVVKANGGKVLGQVRHPLSAADFSSFLLQAQSSKAKIIGLANAGGDTINAIKAAAEFGITKNQSLAGLLVFITDVHSITLNVAQGMLLTEGFYWDFNDQTRAFSKRFFAKAKKEPTMNHAGVYSATLNYLRAIQAAGTDDADAVMAQLKKMKISDPVIQSGQIRADGRLVHDMYLLQVKKPAESKYPWDYYHVKAVIPAAEAFQPLSLSRCPLVKK